MNKIYTKYKDSIKICFSSDNNYAKYLAVTINSIIMNSNKNYYYEIYILDNNIDNENKSRILAMSTNNIFICFININNYIINIDKNIFYIWGHFSISAYYRFFIPRIFYNFDRLLYLDCDLVVLDDLVDLYFSKKLDEKLMLVVHDSIVYLNNQIKEYNSEYWNDYLLNKLKLKNIDNYFQSGVLLFNIKKCFDFNLEKKSLEKLKIIDSPLYLDQCILNAVCENNIDYLDLNYNVECFLPIYLNINNINKYKNSKDYYENQYLKAYNSPKILHYCGHEKPWTHPHYSKSYIWWEYARMTSFYEEIIYKHTNINNISNINNIRNYNRFSLADFIFSFLNRDDLLEIIIIGIRIKIKKKELCNDKYDCFIDRILSIYQNDKYKRITILGIKITTRQDKTRQDISKYYVLYISIILYIIDNINLNYKIKDHTLLNYNRGWSFFV